MRGSDYLQWHYELETRAIYGSAAVRSYMRLHQLAERVVAGFGVQRGGASRTRAAYTTCRRGPSRRRRVRLAPQRRRHRARARVPDRLADAACANRSPHLDAIASGGPDRLPLAAWAWRRL
jgi:hypothetical protein